MQSYSLHTHTKGFDGLHTVEEMVLAAQKLGWDRLGISNHFIVYPDIENTKMYIPARRYGYSAIYSKNFDEAIQKMQSCFEEIDRIRDKTGFTIYKSMEVDFFDTDEWKEGFEKAYQILKPDYIIGSAHFVEYNNTLMNTHDMIRLPQEDKDNILFKYWHNVRQAVKYGAFNFMAHLDLLKRRDIGTEDKWFEEEAKTIELIAQTKVPVEINTSGMKRHSEPNPSLRMLKLLSSLGVCMFLSDDAHNVSSLGQGYEQTENLLKQNNISLITPPLFVARHKDEISEEKQNSLSL